MIDNTQLEQLVARVLAELKESGANVPAKSANGYSTLPAKEGDLVIDLPDPTEESMRRRIMVENPADAEGLRNLCAATTARLGVGRAGPRPKTAQALLFKADHGVTQDAIYGVVSEEVKDDLNLFTVTTRVADRGEYLLRPDLGRLLSDEAKKTIAEKCTKGPDVQICVGDGLSAAAIDNNLREIYPVLEQGLKSAGLTVGTPFFIENARVGIMNDVNTIIGARVLVILIGERPGLGIADAMSAYLGYDPQPGKTDADRDLLCMITTHGGTNPLEAGAYVVELIKRMIKHSASGVKLREAMGEDQ
ncbi:ethanolamine ammonia-lyase [Tessaracoccus lapidicaptus]|uniref:Ethanolamine ammonia-lyase small subunit n=1 Tax=Tessaracoccus lapidicaptus TaxID=1427523 RepID=A0A1C0AKP7_9ACTN|nr:MULTISPECIES: ethanolamine ammonia-lyase subunit EutC [Tessaracoccus]AQX16865.1 ethanolamine ammonia-lyase [Tessaracoccus sp. T2.5-30]OCL33073.1 ethanolamine ammonia-lyase [Tessaracoccus lapidicaptus]VEP41655.1 Ethanolamine ammonia-lyase light chain [Tessaracoccus lapidicaptus]